MEVRSSGFPEAGVEQDKGLLDLGGPGDLALRSSLPAPAPEKLMTTQIKRAHCSWSPKEQPFPQDSFPGLRGKRTRTNGYYNTWHLDPAR